MTKAERIKNMTTDDSTPVFYRTHSSLNLPDRRESGSRRTLEPSLMERVVRRLRDDFSVRHLAAIAAAIGVMALVVWWVNIAVDGADEAKALNLNDVRGEDSQPFARTD